MHKSACKYSWLLRGDVAIVFVLQFFLQLLRGDDAKRWPRVTKPIMVGKTPCKLLCAFEVKVIVTNSWLGINFLALADIRSLGR